MIKFLLITIAVMWLLRFVARLLLPMLFQKVVSKVQDQAQQQYRQQGPQNFNRQKPTGDLHIDYIPPKDKEAKAADKAGDFIDFEEIKPS